MSVGLFLWGSFIGLFSYMQGSFVLSCGGARVRLASLRVSNMSVGLFLWGSSGRLFCEGSFIGLFSYKQGSFVPCGGMRIRLASPPSV